MVAVLVQAVTDPRGQWLLGPQKDARNELRMTIVVNGGWTDLVIDRTFIDEKGQRWVVDYKTQMKARISKVSSTASKPVIVSSSIVMQLCCGRLTASP